MKKYKILSKQNNVFERKVLLEKCYKGREMSKIFLQRTKLFYPNMHSTFDNLETRIEYDLIELLAKFQISATIKTDKRSLPYTNVIISKLILESDVNYMFNFERTYRKILSELLAKDVYKIRFYVHIETFEGDSTVMSRILQCSGVKYCFRYYIH